MPGTSIQLCKVPGVVDRTWKRMELRTPKWPTGVLARKRKARSQGRSEPDVPKRATAKLLAVAPSAMLTSFAVALAENSVKQPLDAAESTDDGSDTMETASKPSKPPEPPSRRKRAEVQPTCQDPSRFREIELLSEAGHSYNRHLRNVRRVAVADATQLKQLSLPGKKSLEEIEEGFFQVQKMHSHVMAKTSQLVYRLQDVLLQEECNRLRKQMHRISTQHVRSPSPSVKSGQTTGLVGTPVERKTSQLREREHDLIVKIVRLVNKRDAILSDLHSEQIRAADEQRQMDREYQKWRGGLVNEDWRCASWQTTTEAVDTTFPEWSRLFLVPPPKKPQNKTLSTLRSIKRRVAKALGNITAKRKNK